MGIFKAKNNIILTKKSLFIEVINTCLNNKEDIKIQSLQKYISLVNNHIENSTLANTPINKVNFKLINNFIIEKEKVFATSTIESLIFIIKTSLRYIEPLKLYKSFDLNEIKPSTKKYKKVEIFGKNEQELLENYLNSKGKLKEVGILLCLYTGIRIGEICGLKTQDIDLVNETIKIERTIIRIKNPDKESKNKTILIESKPKSKTSERIIPIPKFLVEKLKSLNLNKDCYFLSQKEKPLDPRTYEYFYKNCLRKSGINTVKFHALRHTFATRSIEAGIDIKTLSEILGHANIEITLKTYVHSTIELKRVSLEKLASYMQPQERMLVS